MGSLALLLSGAESPSRSASVRQQRGAGSRRGPLSEAVNAKTGDTEQRMVSAKNLSLIKEKLQCVLFLFFSFFFYHRMGPAIAQRLVLNGLG